MSKFEIGDFVYDVVSEKNISKWIYSTKIIGFNDKANKYYCLAYDELSFEPYAIYLIKESQLESIKGSKFENYYPERYIVEEQSKTIPIKIIYMYSIYDVDGLNHKLVRKAILKNR